jgi:hypothetical protein
MAIILPAQIAAGTLPGPYVSRALEAVLLPVNADTIAAFSLDAAAAGVLVLAVAPNGAAEASGIAPGDVIGTVNGAFIKDPIYLDEVVYYWIKHGQTDFGLDLWRAGGVQTNRATITEASWAMVIDTASVADWASYSSESFSYSDYYTEYSAEISTSTSTAEATIEEAASSAEFGSEVSAEQAASEGGSAGIDDSNGDAAAMDVGGGDEAAGTEVDGAGITTDENGDITIENDE